VHEVVRHRERKVAADRPGRCGGRVRRSDRRPDDADRRLAFENERERRRRRDELDELAEERFLRVLRVMTLRQVAVDQDELRRPDRQATPLEAPENVTREATASGLTRTSVRSDTRGA
jgi:hypothetical protein